MIVHLAAAIWAYLRPLSVVHAFSVVAIRAAGMTRRAVRLGLSQAMLGRTRRRLQACHRLRRSG